MNYLDIIAPAIAIIAVSCYISQIITRLKHQLSTITAQRDRMAEALRKHKASLPFAPDFCDVELYEAL
jgi:hypothetical protein